MMDIVYDKDWDGKEVWALINPDGQHADFYESSRERAERYMMAESLTNSVFDAYKAGYKIERIK